MAAILKTTLFILKPTFLKTPLISTFIKPPRRHFIRQFSSPRQQNDKNNIISILEQRGLLESITSENLKTISTTSSLRVYCGFDPTAESLHLGNLIGIIVLSWFIRCGHSVVALVDGATGRVGDPSGKSLERPELDVETLERNISGISGILVRVLDGWGSVKVLNNYDWWKDVKLLDFLRDVGRYARVNVMMNKESVKRRCSSSF